MSVVDYMMLSKKVETLEEKMNTISTNLDKISEKLSDIAGEGGGIINLL